MALSLLLYFGIHEIHCAIEQRQPLKIGRPFYYFMGNLTLGVRGQTDVAVHPESFIPGLVFFPTEPAALNSKNEWITRGPFNLDLYPL